MSSHRYPWKWWLKDLKPPADDAPTVFSTFACGGGSSMGFEQYDLEGNFIAEYESGVEAANALGFRASNIQRCAAGRRKTAHGYRWKYKGVEWRYEYDGRP